MDVQMRGCADVGMCRCGDLEMKVINLQQLIFN